MVEVSAKTGHNVDSLLDMVLLVSDLEELKADEDVLFFLDKDRNIMVGNKNFSYALYKTIED